LGSSPVTSSAVEYSRALVSKPLGGLNDTFCQIQRAINFAQHTGRHLFLDTTESGILGPFNDFFEFVDESPPITFGFPDSELERWNQMSVSPSALEGRVGEFFETAFAERFSIVGEVANRAVRLPREDVDSELVIHHQRGGGRLSLRLLNRIRVTPAIAKEIRAAVSELPTQYAAIHIRATDYTTDYRAVLRRLGRKEKKLPVVVCSDNADVLTDAKRILGDSRVFHFPDTTGVTPGTPLHDAGNYDSDEQKRQATVSVLRDIFAMSGAATFYYAPIEQKGKFGQVTFSGLTMLVRYLHANPKVRAQFFAATAQPSDFLARTDVLLTDWPTRARLTWERHRGTARRRKA